MALYDLRINYDQDTLLEDKIPQDPLTLFDTWFKQSQAKEPNAMCLSTVSDNKPSSRMVLCKSYSSDGFTFFTNHNSRKGLEISNNPFASIVFYWEQRSVRVEGVLSKLSDKSSQDYFSSRPRESQIGAWTSPQSQILSSRKELDDLYLKTVEKFKNVECIPKPEFWGGYILKPDSIEFWQGRPSRLHDRIKYIKTDLGPKRRFLTEKSQIPTRLNEVKPMNKIYFTPSKPQDQIFISTPSSKYSSKYTTHLQTVDYTPLPTHTQPVNILKVESAVNTLKVDSPESFRKVDSPVVKVSTPFIQTPVHSLDFTPQESKQEVVRDVENVFTEKVKVVGKSNKRAFYEEEKIKTKKLKTPRKVESLKRKSTFTVMDQEDLDLLPEKGWITPASRRLGRKAARRPIVKEKSSVMCQTLPVQQESKRIKVTPAIDRFKPKIPDSISKPVLQGNELDEKTVQVLLNAAKENTNISQKSELGFKVPLPLAKENISPNAQVDEVAVGITGVPAVTAPELPKFSFSAPASTLSSLGSTPASSSVSPPKPAFSFSLPGSTAPILSTVPAADSAVTPEKPAFVLPSSSTSIIGTTAAPTSTAAPLSSFPSFGIPISGPAAPTSTAGGPATFSFPAVAVSTPGTVSATPKVAAAAPAFNFGTPSAPPATAAPSTAPITFSFGAKPTESIPSVSAAPPSFGAKENAVSSVPTFGSGVPAATSAAPTLSFSFGQSAPTSTSTLGFGSSVAPSTAAPQTAVVTQSSVASPAVSAFGFGSSNASSTVAPQTTNAGQASSASAFTFGSSATPSTAAPQTTAAPSAVPSFAFGSSVTPSTAATQSTGVAQASATPSFGFGQASKSSVAPSFSAAPGTAAPSGFGQTATSTTPFGQSNSSTSAPFLQAAPSSTPFAQPAAAGASFGQTTSAPFGQSSSVTPSPFGQGSSSTTPFGQSASVSSVPFGQTSTTTGQSSAAFGTAQPTSAFGQNPSSFAQPGSTPASFGQAPTSTGFSSTGSSFGQGAGFSQASSGFPSSTFGQGTASSTFNPPTPAAPFGAPSAPFGNSGPVTTSASFGFSNAPAQFGAQAPTNTPAQFAPSGGSTFSFGQPQGGAPAFSFGAQSPAGAPAASGFSFNAAGGPQMPQMPSGPGFSLGAGGDTTRKLAQPKGRLRKAGLRR